MKSLHIFILVFSPVLLCAQLHDYTWIMGYGGGANSPDQDTFGLSIMDFTNEQLTIYDNQYGEAFFWSNNVSLSNYSGGLLFSFTGQGIYNKNHDLVANGEDWFEGELNEGWFQAQSGLMFQNYNDTNRVHLINIENNVLYLPPITDVFGDDLYYSVITTSDNNENGEVTVRKKLLLSDTLAAGKLSACKHANGRDWWIIVPKWNSKEYHRFLLTPQGIDTMGIMEVSEPIYNGLGQAVFSPDGNKYVYYSAMSLSDGEWVSVYDFDRCTGMLSNVQQANFPLGGNSGGAGISKDSRYLYTTSNIYIYQYDLQAEDVLATRTLVAEYDGHLDPFPTNFYQAQLAPDGKIYICSANGVHSMHVIHHPNQECPDCFIEQHSIELPTYNAFSIPNQPNYRLGPIDGSPCDTLGIDNIPLCRWRYTQDTLSPLQVHFTDLSDYEPTEWLWGFGDNTTSTEINPTHTFQEEGTYEVCLTVSNENGSDTQCKELTFEIISMATEEDASVPVATLFPNPFRRYLTLSLRPGWLPTDARVLVYDQVGRLVQQRRLSAGINTLDLMREAAGMYFYQIIAEGKLVQSGAVVKE
jgi:hypothetical protein